MRDCYLRPHRWPDATGALRTFDPLRTLLVEQYLEGIECSVECVAIGAQVYPLMIHEKVAVRERAYTVYEDLLITPPPTLTVAAQQALRAASVGALTALGITNTFAHVELRYNAAQGAQIIEVNPRIGGGLITRSLATCCGFDPFAMKIQLLLGQALPPASATTDGYYGMGFFFPDAAGLLQIEGVAAVGDLAGVVDIQQVIPNGTVVNGLDEEYFAAMLWMHGDSPTAVERTFVAAQRLLTIAVSAVK